MARRVGRYELLGELGRGGMSIVHRARHVDLGRTVALKELAAFHAAQPGAAERFVRESQLAGALSHPNVVTVHDFFEEAGTPYIAMELLGHGSLRPLVGTLSLPQIAGVLEGVLAALTRAELAGVVHRDLKPENLLLSDDGRVKIADFGIAKARSAVRSGTVPTIAGTAVGTPEYMAPEQALGGEIGPWTDLYSIGVVSYELLTGRVPFPGGEGDEPLAVLLRHVSEPVVPPARVDAELAAWVMRLLEKDPARRTRSAAQARDELEDIVLRLAGPRWRRDAGLPVDGPARGLPGGAAATAAFASVRHRWRWVLATVAAAVTAGAGIGLLSAADETPQTTPAAPPRLVRSEAVSVRLPADWRIVPERLRGGVSGNGPAGERLDVAVVAGHGPLLLPVRLRGAGTAAPARVRLGALEAQRWTTGDLTTWAIPLTADVLVLRCRSSRGVCATVAATARPLRATPTTPGPTSAYAARLGAALGPVLRRAGDAARSTDPEVRAEAAARLARAATDGRARLGTDPPGAWESAVHPQLRAALAALHDAARVAAGAARTDDRARMRSSESRLAAALHRLRDTRARLRALGYR